MTRTVDAQSMNFGMGTVMTHKAFGQHAQESLRAVSYEAERLEEMLSCCHVLLNSQDPAKDFSM